MIGILWHLREKAPVPGLRERPGMFHHGMILTVIQRSEISVQSHCLLMNNIVRNLQRLSVLSPVSMITVALCSASLAAALVTSINRPLMRFC